MTVLIEEMTKNLIEEAREETLTEDLTTEMTDPTEDTKVRAESEEVEAGVGVMKGSREESTRDLVMTTEDLAGSLIGHIKVAEERSSAIEVVLIRVENTKDLKEVIVEDTLEKEEIAETTETIDIQGMPLTDQMIIK